MIPELQLYVDIRGSLGELPSPRVLEEILSAYPGNQYVRMFARTSGGIYEYEFGDRFQVDAFDPLLHEECRRIGCEVAPE